MIKRAVNLAAAIAAMAAAAAVCVIAAAYALYALLRYALTPPGAAAVVALAFALIAALIGVILLRKGNPPSVPQEELPLSVRVFELARERPIIAGVAAAAAGLILLRNPKLIATAVTAAMAGRAAERSSEQRRGWGR